MEQPKDGPEVLVRVAGVVLASGMSQRFGVDNKLLAQVGSDAVIRHTARAYVDSGLSPVLVVVGYQAELVTAALHGLPLEIVQNHDFASGQSRALVAGVRALPGDVAAAVIGVGDQPLLRSDVITRLVATFRRERPPLVAPRYAGSRGNPILFARALFPELCDVSGDVGGRPVLDHHHDEIRWLDVGDQHVALDVDTAADLVRANRLRR